MYIFKENIFREVYTEKYIGRRRLERKAQEIGYRDPFGAGYILDGNVKKITKTIYESLLEEIRLIGDQTVREDQVHKDMKKWDWERRML